MTNEFDPTMGGFQPGTPEAYQADELQKETEKKEQEDRNVAAGLNPDGTPKEEPAKVEPAPANPSPAPAAETPKVDYRNEKIPFVKDAPLGDLSLTGEQLLIKEKLAKQPKYSFYIPLDPGEKKGAVRPVIINTYRCEVPKGMQVQVPYSIYQLLVQAYDAEAEVLQNHESNLANADAEKRRALGL